MKAECEDLRGFAAAGKEEGAAEDDRQPDRLGSGMQLRTRKSEGGAFALRRFCLWDMGNAGSQDSQRIISNTELALRAGEGWKVIHVRTQLEALSAGRGGGVENKRRKSKGGSGWGKQPHSKGRKR